MKATQRSPSTQPHHRSALKLLDRQRHTTNDVAYDSDHAHANVRRNTEPLPLSTVIRRRGRARSADDRPTIWTPCANEPHL